MHRYLILSFWLLGSLLLVGCASQRVIPESLEPLVDTTVTFAQVVAAPDSFQGRVVVFGGEVLKAKRLKEGTEIELLQLPLDKDNRPTFDRQQ
jgi:outer membrane lipoprotein